MKRFLKKTVALVLCVALLGGLCVSTQAVNTDYPVVYIGTIAENRLYTNPNTQKMAALLMPDEDTQTRYLLCIVGGLLYATIGGQSKDGTSLLLKGLNGLLGGIACDEYGNSADTTVGVNTYKYPLSYYLKDEEVQKENLTAVIEACGTVGLDRTYLFNYDWRLSPIDNAELLNDFIVYVKGKTGAQKVSLLCGGNGGVVANSYLYNYETAALRDLASCVFLDCPLQGNSLVGDLMRGNLQQFFVEGETIFDSYHQITGDERANALVRYVNDDPYSIFLSIFEDLFGESPETVAAATGIVWIVNYFLGSNDAWADIAKSYNTYVYSQGSVVYDSCLRAVLCNSPGLWALVPAEESNDAYAFLFGEEEMNARLKAKLDAYTAVQAATATTLQRIRSGGVNVCVVAGYNLQVLPITGTINEHSDCITLTKYASVGATTVELNSATLEVVQKVDDGHIHLAPDSTVDASTCALPENTWFIRNLPNMKFSSVSAANFVAWLLCSDHQRSVWEEVQYPQFQNYSRGRKAIYALSNGATNNLYGDVNLDGIVTAADAREALRHSVDLEPIPTHLGQVLADMDVDGDITAADARYILRVSVKLDPNVHEG